MKVKELIEVLKDIDGELPVWAYIVKNGRFKAYPIDGVQLGRDWGETYCFLVRRE